MHVLLETDRLILRRFTDTDADAALLLELDSDPEVMHYIGPFGLGSVQAYRERIRKNWFAYYTAHLARGVWAGIEKCTGRFIGYCLLRPSTDYRYATEAVWRRPTDLEVGYRLRRAFWGQGLATEAATGLVQLALADPEVTGVVSCALVANRASTRVMEKAGLSRVGEFMIPVFNEPCVKYELRRQGSDWV